MNIAIQYLAQIKHAVGRASEALQFGEACTLAELLRHLADRHGEGLGRLLFAPTGSVNESLLLFVGDAQAHGDALLKDGDVVTVLAPMAGG